MPVPSRPRTPGPLANLPRPLDERERGRGRGRRIASIIGIAGVIGVIAVVAHAVLPAMVPPVGDVAGAVATVQPGPSVARATPLASSAAVASVAPSPGPSSTPSPSPSPAPSLAPTLPPTGPGVSPPVTRLAVAVHTPDGYRPPEPTPLAPQALTGYRWPLAHGRITLPFGPTAWGTRVVDGELFHDGIDLATFCGDRVVAAHAGTVIAAGRHFDDEMGWVGDLRPYYDRLQAKHLWFELPIVVVIADGNGYRSMYAHFSDIAVKRGQVVKAGQFLGHEGRTGRATGCHVHYGLFSPLETATFKVEPGVVARMKVPSRQVARIDPLLVLPARHVPAASSAKPGTDQPISP